MCTKRKFQTGNTFQGTVGGTTLTAIGRTKREATVRLRRMFAAIGSPTKPDALVDLLSNVIQGAPPKKVAKPKAVKAPKVAKPRAPRKPKAAKLAA